MIPPIMGLWNTYLLQNLYDPYPVDLASEY